MNARNREEEYLRKVKALGYEPSLAGMDDDIEWELSTMEEAAAEARSASAAAVADYLPARGPRP